MRFAGLCRKFFAVGIIGLGILSLIYGDFALVKLRVPHWLPLGTEFAYASGALVVACGIGLFFARTATITSRILFIYLLCWLLLLRIPNLAMTPSVILSWYVFGETTALLAGTWVLLGMFPDRGRSLLARVLGGTNGIRAARILFGVALFLFGLSHFGYLKYTASLVPNWLPWHLGWACLTGGGYVAACVSILLEIYPRLAAVLTAAMMGVFTLSIWIPRVAVMPTDQRQWTELLSSWTLAASAWLIADSYRGAPWLSRRKLSIAAVKPEDRTVV